VCVCVPDGGRDSARNVGGLFCNSEANGLGVTSH
jgi:hypothetical protein